MPGDWVVVKEKEAIRATLDGNGRNRGLAFESELLPYCGKAFRVLRRVERLIVEMDAHGQELVGLISADALNEDRKSRARTRGTTAA